MSESPSSMYLSESISDTSIVSGKALSDPQEPLRITTGHVLTDMISSVFRKRPDSGAGLDATSLPLRRSPPAPLWVRMFTYSVGILYGETYQAPSSITVWRTIFVVTETTVSVLIVIASTLVKSPTHPEMSQWKVYNHSTFSAWLFSWIFLSLILIYDFRMWIRPMQSTQKQPTGFQSGILTACAIGWGVAGINLIGQSVNGSEVISKESSPLLWWIACLFTVFMLMSALVTVAFMALIPAVTLFQVWRNGYCHSRDLPIPYPKARIPSRSEIDINKLDDEIPHIPIAYYIKNSSRTCRNDDRKPIFLCQPLQLEGEKKANYALRVYMDHSKARCHLCQQIYVTPEEAFSARASPSMMISNHVPDHLELRCLPCKHVFHAWCLDRRLRMKNIPGKCPLCSKYISMMFFADPEAVLLA